MKFDKVQDSKTKSIVAYFDFDGTITTNDTLFPFVIYVAGWFKLILNVVGIAFLLVLYLTKIISNERAKEFFLTIMFKGMPFEFIEQRAKDFAFTKLDKCIKPEIYAKLEYHLEHKHKIILVSANLGLYLRHWAVKHQLFGVIATEIESSRGVVTGSLATKNCYGKQKVHRIREFLMNHNIDFDYSYGYGNSAGDYELLKYVDEGYWVRGSDIISWKEYCDSKT